MRSLRFCVLVIALSAMQALTTPTNAAPTPIPLGPYVGLLRTIDIEIGGRRARMLFDTGAGITAITPEFASEIGCTPYGVISAFRMDGERVTFQRCPETLLRIGNASRRAEIAVFDLNAVLPPELPSLDGVVGLDAFTNHTITMLPGLAGIRIENRASAGRATAGLEAVRTRLSREAAGMGATVFVPATTAQGELWLLVDSGNLAGLRLHPWAYAALSLSPSGGARQVEVAGAAPWIGEPQVVSSLIYDGALDARFLADFAITIDLAGNHIWWRRAASH